MIGGSCPGEARDLMRKGNAHTEHYGDKGLGREQDGVKQSPVLPAEVMTGFAEEAASEIRLKG